MPARHCSGVIAVQRRFRRRSGRVALNERAEQRGVSLGTAVPLSEETITSCGGSKDNNANQATIQTAIAPHKSLVSSREASKEFHALTVKARAELEGVPGNGPSSMKWVHAGGPSEEIYAMRLDNGGSEALVGLEEEDEMSETPWSCDAITKDVRGVDVDHVTAHHKTEKAAHQEAEKIARSLALKRRRKVTQESHALARRRLVQHLDETVATAAREAKQSALTPETLAILASLPGLPEDEFDNACAAAISSAAFSGGGAGSAGPEVIVRACAEESTRLSQVAGHHPNCVTGVFVRSFARFARSQGLTGVVRCSCDALREAGIRGQPQAPSRVAAFRSFSGTARMLTWGVS